MWTSPIRIIYTLFCVVITLIRADVYSPVIQKIIKAASAGLYSNRLRAWRVKTYGLSFGLQMPST